MLNRIILIGRLVKDPELRYTPAGIAVSTYTLAVDRNFSGGDGEREADFIPIVVWRQLAETVANYLRKGRLCAVEGRIQVRNYENNEGKRIYVTEVIADNVRFLESNRENGSGNAGGSNAGGGAGGGSRNNSGSGNGGSRNTGSQSGGQGSGYNQSQDPFANDGNPIDISEDDLPF